MDMPENWTGVFRSQAETVGLPMINEHNIGGVHRPKSTTFSNQSVERIGAGLALAVFLGCRAGAENLF